MAIKSIWLRRIHKWVGLVIGLQFVLWAISGAAMALLDMETVAGGPPPDAPVPAMASDARAWPRILRQLGAAPIEAMRSTTVLDRTVLEIRTAGTTRLFDARTGEGLAIDAGTARAIAQAAHRDRAAPQATTLLTAPAIPVREHAPPIWAVSFADRGSSTYYVSATNGALLERRNDSWRWWDFFWMLHSMDYAGRTNFNHPLIVTVAIAMGWLAITGFWLLFRTMWRHDLAWLARRFTREKR